MEKALENGKSGSVRSWFCGFALAYVLLVGNANSFASTITLQWDPETASDLAGYKVYYSTTREAPFTGAGAVEGASPVAISPQTTATITGLDPGQAHYFAVTAYNTAGVESPYSNIVEVPELIPPSVFFSYPANSATVSGTVAVSANASDNLALDRVETYVNGVLKSTATAGPYLYSWDTSALAAGAYTLTAKAYDAAGNVGESSVSVTVANDAAAPIVLLTAPADGATVRGVLPISANATDDVAVSKFELYANGTLLYAGNIPPFSYNWDTSAVANGPYTLSAKAYDAVGNVGHSANAVVIVENDDIAPSISIVGPGSGSVAGGTVAVSANAFDNVGIARVEFYLNGALVSSDTEAPYGYSWDTLKSVNGAYTLGAKAYDAAGNIGLSAGVAVNVLNDTVAPTVAISGPVGNSTAGMTSGTTSATTASGTAVVTATANDDVAVSRVEFLLDGILQATSTQAPYSFTWNTTAAANGIHTLSAKAYDAAGNIGHSAGVAVDVFNDGASPVVAITSPASNSTAGESVAVTVSANDNVAVSRVEFLVNGLLQATSSQSPYSFTWNTTASPNGAYTLTAKAYDAAGNVGHSAGVTVNVSNDSTAPAVAITSPVTNSTAGQSVTVSISANDDVAVERVELYVDGTLKGSITSAPYSYTLNTWSLPNGAHTLTARAYDGAGNQGESSRVVLNVYNDNLPPTVTNFSMPAIDNTLTVPVSSFQATDNTGIAGYLITESATAPSASAEGWSATAPTSFTFAGTGSRTAYAWVRDAAGHVSASASATLMIDTVLPVITSLVLLNDTGIVTVKAAAQDNVAVSKMQLYLDNMLQEETLSGSMSYPLPVPVKRSQTMTLRVYDLAGNLRSQSLRVSKN